MTEHAYIAIAGTYARRIRSGEFPPGIQLPSYSALEAEHNVSKAVVRQTLDLLVSLGLVRSIPRRGFFVTDNPNLIRVSPERQLETAEETFRNESSEDIRIERDVSEVAATTEQVEAFGLNERENLTLTVTRAAEGRRPVSISETYQPLGVEGIDSAVSLEEFLRDDLPDPTHAEWLGLQPGDLVKIVQQKFFDDNGHLVMASKISYPRDRYKGFRFRMDLRSEPAKLSSD